MSKPELQKEISSQTKVLVGAGASGGFAVVAIPFTMGLSVIMLGAIYPVARTAKKKRVIAKKYLNLPEPRKRIVCPPRSGPSQSTYPKPAKPSKKCEQLPAYTPPGASFDTGNDTSGPVDASAAEQPPSYDNAAPGRAVMMNQRSPLTEDDWK